MVSAPISPLKDQKKLRRRALRAALAAIPPHSRRDDSRRAAAALLPWIEERVRARAGPVALFASMPEEIDTCFLDDELRARGLRRCFPAFDGDVMRFHEVPVSTSIAALPCGAMNIPTPPADAPLVDARELAVVVVPGLGFDAAGGRLGRGKGYYDKALAHVDLERAVGVGLDAQLCDEALPMEPWDVRLRWLCTPARGVFRARD